MTVRSGTENGPDTAISVAVVGLSRWGGRLATAARNAELNVASCYARRKEVREDFSHQFQCDASPSWDAILNDVSIDAVLLATPPDTHARLVIEAASAKKHVFVEKPFCLQVADGAAAVRACEDAHVVLQVGHNRRRQASVRRIKIMIEDGYIGEVRHGEIQLSRPVSPRLLGTDSAGLSPWHGSIADFGVHSIDTLIYLLGLPTRVVAFSQMGAAQGQLDTTTTALLDFVGGASISLTSSMETPLASRLGIFGTRGATWSENDGDRLFVQLLDDRDRAEIPVETVDTVRDELEEFASCVRSGIRPETGGMEGLQVVTVFQSLLESAREGVPIEIMPPTT